MNVLLLQPPYPWGGTLAAARSCTEWMLRALEDLSPGEADLVLLPEYASAPGLETASLLDAFAAVGREFLAAVGRNAARIGTGIGVGTVTSEGGLRFNRTLLLSRDGETVARYDKRHLTAAEEEQLGISAGSDGPATARLDGWRCGFATCFEVYFPEHFAVLAAAKVDLILHPTYQRSESAERIRLISAARALDSGAWLLRASYATGHAGTGAHSLVASPEGDIIADAGEEPAVLAAEFDPSRRFVKPASHGQPDTEHRSLIEERRRPVLYRPNPDRRAALLKTPFPRICAHRGLSEACPENTLPAFAAALSYRGVHEIELDVWLSKDGVPVVCHDPRVDRTTDGTGLVTELDWRTIRSFDAGVRCSEAWRGVALPRLEEVLELVGTRAFLNIHIKAPGPDGVLVELVGNALRAAGLTRLGYIAGEEDVLAAALKHAPAIPRASLAHQQEPARLIETALAYRCERVQFFRNVTAEDVQRAHRHGLVCNLFWSDEVTDARAYAAKGIDVILTNRAHRLAGRIRVRFPSTGDREIPRYREADAARGNPPEGEREARRNQDSFSSRIPS